MFLKAGKLPWVVLEKLLAKLPSSDVDLIIGPSVGEDAAIIRLRDGFLVVHSDPITAASRRIGWLAIHIAANDIAVRGVKPRWFLPVVLLPKQFGYNDIEAIFSDMASAVNSLNGVVIGGHTEISPGIDKPLISTTVIGYTGSQVVLTRNAKAGDKLLVIGRVGGEGAGVIAWDFEDVLKKRGVEESSINLAKDFLMDISVVDKALLLKNHVSSMHDPTEGGVLQGLREVSLASGYRIYVDLNSIKLDPVVERIANVLNIDPLRLLSSGALIASIPDQELDQAIDLLEKHGYQYSICGYVSSERDPKLVLLRKGSVVEIVDEDVIDEIYKLW